MTINNALAGVAVKDLEAAVLSSVSGRLPTRSLPLVVNDPDGNQIVFAEAFTSDLAR